MKDTTHEFRPGDTIQGRFPHDPDTLHTATVMSVDPLRGVVHTLGSFDPRVPHQWEVVQYPHHTVTCWDGTVENNRAEGTRSVIRLSHGSFRGMTGAVRTVWVHLGQRTSTDDPSHEGLPGWYTVTWRDPGQS